LSTGNTSTRGQQCTMDPGQPSCLEKDHVGAIEIGEVQPKEELLLIEKRKSKKQAAAGFAKGTKRASEKREGTGMLF